VDTYRLRSPRVPRHFGVAAALSLLTPGLGHIYCGLLRRGLAVMAICLATLLLLLFGWARWLFVPVVPLAILAMAGVATQFALIGDLSRWCARHGADFELRPLNHPVAYLGLFLGLWVLPLVLAGGAVASWYVGSFEVRDEAMFPRLLVGDRVLFERDAYLARAPAPGELVIVAPVGRPGTVGRVIATEGSVVQLRDARPVVDGEPILRRRVEGLRVPRFGVGPLAASLASLEGYLERAGAREYLVTYDRLRPTMGDPSPITLGPDELYVVGDNRDKGAARRYPVSAVKGRPRYVWGSFDERGDRRDGRVGLELR
jgi:hypothetical protein